jgi:hypothetical protein
MVVLKLCLAPRLHLIRNIALYFRSWNYIEYLQAYSNNSIIIPILLPSLSPNKVTVSRFCLSIINGG